MDNLQLLHQLLVALGGGDGGHFHETVMHLLYVAGWLLLFSVGALLVARRPQPHMKWLLIIIALGFVRDLFYVSVEIYILIVNQSANSQLSPLSVLHHAPWVAAGVCLGYFLLIIAVFKCLNVSAIHGHFRNLGKLCLLVGVLVFFGFWSVHNGLSFESEFLPLTINVYTLYFYLTGFSLLLYALIQSVFQRWNSHITRVAWLPLSIYLVSLLLDTAAVLMHDNSASIWLAPIANTFCAISMLGFGYLLLKEMSDERRLLNERLNRSQRLEVMSSLTVGVAHDFNNHLQSIMGYAEVGKQKAHKNHIEQIHYDNIIESTKRAGLLVSELIRLKSNTFQTEVVDVCLSDVLHNLSPIVNGLLGNGLEIVNNLHPLSGIVHVDRNKLDQAIINVVVNARDAMPEGGTLTVYSEPIMQPQSLRYKYPMIRLYLQDTGVGMSEDEKNRVFEPFYTTKGAREDGGSGLGNRIGGGSGLGLATSLTAIRTMGGEMSVESTLGEGTTLIIDLPASSDAAARCLAIGKETNPAAIAAAEAEDIGEYEFGFERILLADDEPGPRHIAASQLRRAGYDVSVAHDGEQAMEMVRKYTESFDLLVLDVIMPKKDGYALYEEVKALHPNIPVVFVTANTHLASHKRPAEPHLTKPFKRQALLKLVRKTIDSQLG